ncbi:MAG: hypothetical protein ABSE63_00915 [Thermoguttaceae bacterium]
MDLDKSSLDSSSFMVGQGVVTDTPTPLIDASFVRTALRGVHVHARTDNDAPILVSNGGTVGYELKVGEDLDIPIDSPAKVYVFSTENESDAYDWFSI